ncbi:hypothetical protein [Methylobacterium sp. J-070]|uniref:hypothetical protein n=1 Tax=Methylobacterium sp. J-070 TaxID=2836650 RepID=UPI001FB98970|nr:hypothetical protein [Methylobacterium sp. J-070]MCJ2054048.1 hypothetical protein [Methylobacterium sp. J-070]
MTTDAQPTPFLDALRRIEELTKRIHQGGLAHFDSLEAEMTEIREIRSALAQRIAGVRRARG